MATIIESEQGRPYNDENNAGRFFASQFQITAGDAIRDPSLAPEAKYTSGPYGRAAWLITQIRSLVGEDRFWEILRGVLKAHAYGTIDGDEFLAAFRADLGDERWQQATAALSARKLPVLTAAATNASPAGVAVTLTDPDGSMIAPLALRSYKDADTMVEKLLTSGSAVTLAADPSTLWVIDPDDRHPLPALMDQGFMAEVQPLLVPRTPTTKAVYGDLSASAQELALSAPQPWFADAADFLAIYKSLAGEEARAEALHMGCDQGAAAGQNATARPAWADAISRTLLAPPYLGISSWYLTPRLGSCLPAAGGSLFADDLKELAANPADDAFPAPRLQLLTTLGLVPADALAALGAVGLSGSSSWERIHAVGAMVEYVNPKTNVATRPTGAELAEWQAYFRDVLAKTQVSDVLRAAIQGIVAGEDTSALPNLQQVILGAYDSPVQIMAACGAYTLTKADAAAWTAFVKGLGDLDHLADSVADAVTNPESCAPSI
jgi:hypothetical protein